MMRTEFSAGNNLNDEDDTSESEDQSSSSDEVTVTRSNVIDIVEDYEGHQLDTDTYIYKEPEKIAMVVGGSRLQIKKAI